jgi:hypothetical protein
VEVMESTQSPNAPTSHREDQSGPEEGTAASTAHPKTREIAGIGSPPDTDTDKAETPEAASGLASEPKEEDDTPTGTGPTGGPREVMEPAQSPTASTSHREDQSGPEEGQGAIGPAHQSGLNPESTDTLTSPSQVLLEGSDPGNESSDSRRMSDDERVDPPDLGESPDATSEGIDPYSESISSEAEEYDSGNESASHHSPSDTGPPEEEDAQAAPNQDSEAAPNRIQIQADPVEDSKGQSTSSSLYPYDPTQPEASRNPTSPEEDQFPPASPSKAPESTTRSTPGSPPQANKYNLPQRRDREGRQGSASRLSTDSAPGTGKGSPRGQPGHHRPLTTPPPPAAGGTGRTADRSLLLVSTEMYPRIQ